MASSPTPRPPIPVLLLKTKSSPGDSYEELLSCEHEGRRFAPCFVPVLHHHFEEPGLERLRDLLRGRRIGTGRGCEFGGVIFTSQRAVEAFAHVVQEGPRDDDPQWPHLQDVPIYSVGPATTRAISAIPQRPPLQVFGSHTGNGEALANFILDHYAARQHHHQHHHQHDGAPALPPLLFPIGAQRRDVVPKTLTDASLPSDRRIPVAEEVVYGTGVMESFPADLAAALAAARASASRWVVVFSPTGCEALLRGMGVLDAATGRYMPGARDGRTFVATIGPTTREHLLSTFGFEPDVCAESPTPTGVVQGILAFEKGRGTES
ncbi:Uroporphyrinogen-III synthase [Escovopsis weberi]|uniref:Uroporphyrinogen-III synthase n=1 Tax=Escovopsis weberi TaxID=150374 RepID=A0A0M9VSW0_ESCWE|nr:Uroporphyrinogen-III synthase [Escovopsis weberi]